MTEPYENKTSYLHGLRQWFRNRLVQKITDDYQACVFECHQSECAMGDWEKCERRLRSKAQGQEQI